jgi:hypothetical protein
MHKERKGRTILCCETYFFILSAQINGRITAWLFFPGKMGWFLDEKLKF